MCSAARDIKVFPAPHSAITAARRSVSHFFAIPIAATACEERPSKQGHEPRRQRIIRFLKRWIVVQDPVAQFAREHAEVILHRGWSRHEIAFLEVEIRIKPEW